MLNEHWSTLRGNCTARVVGRLCWAGGRWPARPEADVEVVLACVSQRDRAQGCDTALACSEEGMLWVPQCLGGTSGDANLQEEG